MGHCMLGAKAGSIRRASIISSRKLVPSQVCPDPVCSCEHGGKVRVCTRAAAGRVEGRSDRSRLVQ